MTEQRDVATRGSAEVTERGREPEAALRPPADIFEDAEGITVQLDMPGVSRDRLAIQVDKNTLLVEGAAQIEMPEGMEALYADVRATRFRRSFALSGELDTDRIDANVRNGVLILRIPKRAEVRPRKIEVRAG